MQSIDGISIAPDACDWLKNSRHPRILHVFDRICNLINERNEVLSIVTQNIGDGPFNLVIDKDIAFPEHLNFRSTISIRAKQINLGNVTINAGKAIQWNPLPDWEHLHANKENILDQLIPFNRSLHMKAPFIKAGLMASTIFEQQKIISTSLISALSNADLSTSRNCAYQLAGLGGGLTPAGDDFILGAVLGTWTIHLPEIAASIAGEVANAAAPLTTSLSAAWLRSAGKGEAGILWHNLLTALNSADTLAVQRCIKNNLEIGHSSGADALEGFISMLLRWSIIYSTTAEGSLCPS